MRACGVRSNIAGAHQDRERITRISARAGVDRMELALAQTTAK